MKEGTRLGVRETAVLCMDYQREIVENFAVNNSAALKQAARVLEFARSHSIRVIYVVIQFRSGYPEVSPANPIFSRITQTNRFVAGAPGAEVHELVQPKSGDIIVAKKRVSGFAGSDLEMILRGQGISNLVLFGIATSGVVLSTLRQAADLDFNCFVLEDLCLDSDPEVHACLTKKIFPRQATVETSASFMERFE